MSPTTGALQRPPRRRPRHRLALSLLCGWCLHGTVAKTAGAQIKRAVDYHGPLDVKGTVYIRVDDVYGAAGNVVDYDLTGVDPRCANSTIPVHLGCALAIHQGTTCSAMGDVLSGKAGEKNPWGRIRYDAMPDGRAEGLVKVMYELSQQDMYHQAMSVTDFDGTYVACGRIEAACLLILGVCFTWWARLVTGVATVLAVLSSVWLIRAHLLYNQNPVLCRYTARILLMVPIYSVQAFVSLWMQVSPSTAEIMRFFRELYEAVVILSFLEFILICVGGPEHVVRHYDGAGHRAEECTHRIPSGENEVHENSSDGTQEEDSNCDSADSDVGPAKLGHICPWSWFCPRWRSARQMLRLCTLGTLTYVLAGIAVPCVALLCKAFCRPEALEQVIHIGKYCFMVSSMMAINSLFELAHVFLHELQSLSPLAKFASVKMVIFFTFWQGLVLTWTDKAGLLQDFVDVGHKWNSSAQIAEAIQHGLICIEMFIASVVHHWAFPPLDYKVVKHMAAARSAMFNSTPSHRRRRRREAVTKGVQVIDFRDIFLIAREGIAPTRFEAKAREDTDSSDTSDDENEEEVSDDDGENPTRP